MIQDKNTWISETNPNYGLKLSLQVKQRCHYEKTPYQTIEIYETEGFGYLMVIDGFFMLSQRDNFLYHEMMAHIPLLTHPNPQNVVIIGGGDCGTLTECLKHPITKITQIDIDQRVTELSKQYFPELCQKNNDPRVTLLFEDGIQWMKQAASASLDVIIVDSTDPFGPAEGLFTEIFYQNCYRTLRENGIIVQQSGSCLLHEKTLKRVRSNMCAASFQTLNTFTFPQPVYPPGWWSATMATKSQKFHPIRELELLNTHYYCHGVHSAAMQEIPMIQKIVNNTKKSEPVSL